MRYVGGMDELTEGAEHQHTVNWLRHCLREIAVGGHIRDIQSLHPSITETVWDCIENPPPSPELTEPIVVPDAEEHGGDSMRL